MSISNVNQNMENRTAIYRSKLDIFFDRMKSMFKTDCKPGISIAYYTVIKHLQITLNECPYGDIGFQYSIIQSANIDDVPRFMLNVTTMNTSTWTCLMHNYFCLAVEILDQTRFINITDIVYDYKLKQLYFAKLLLDYYIKCGNGTLFRQKILIEEMNDYVISSEVNEVTRLLLNKSYLTHIINNANKLTYINLPLIVFEFLGYKLYSITAQNIVHDSKLIECSEKLELIWNMIEAA